MLKYLMYIQRVMMYFLRHDQHTNNNAFMQSKFIQLMQNWKSKLYNLGLRNIQAVPVTSRLKAPMTLWITLT